MEPSDVTNMVASVPMSIPSSRHQRPQRHRRANAMTSSDDVISLCGINPRHHDSRAREGSLSSSLPTFLSDTAMANHRIRSPLSLDDLAASAQSIPHLSHHDSSASSTPPTTPSLPIVDTGILLNTKGSDSSLTLSNRASASSLGRLRKVSFNDNVAYIPRKESIDANANITPLSSVPSTPASSISSPTSIQPAPSSTESVKSAKSTASSILSSASQIPRKLRRKKKDKTKKTQEILCEPSQGIDFMEELAPLSGLPNALPTPPLSAQPPEIVVSDRSSSEIQRIPAFQFPSRTPNPSGPLNAHGRCVSWAPPRNAPIIPPSRERPGSLYAARKSTTFDPTNGITIDIEAAIREGTQANVDAAEVAKRRMSAVLEGDEDLLEEAEEDLSTATEESDLEEPIHRSPTPPFVEIHSAPTTPTKETSAGLGVVIDEPPRRATSSQGRSLHAHKNSLALAVVDEKQGHTRRALSADWRRLSFSWKMWKVTT